jgi:hypothetical protein
VRADEPLDPANLGPPKSSAARQSHWPEPKLGYAVVALDVDMGCLAAIAE